LELRVLKNRFGLADPAGEARLTLGFDEERGRVG